MNLLQTLLDLIEKNLQISFRSHFARLFILPGSTLFNDKYKKVTWKERDKEKESTVEEAHSVDEAEAPWRA